MGYSAALEDPASLVGSGVSRPADAEMRNTRAACADTRRLHMPAAPRGLARWAGAIPTFPSLGTRLAYRPVASPGKGPNWLRRAARCPVHHPWA